MVHFETFLDEGTGRDLIETLTANPADAIVCDCLMLGALQAAQEAGLPTLVLTHSFWGFFGQAFPHSPITEMGAPVGRAPLDLWSAADEVLVLADEALDPATTPLPANVRWTGVVQEPVSPAPRHDRSHVLLSLSTVWFPGQQEAMQRILDALADLPVRVTATRSTTLTRRWSPGWRHGRGSLSNLTPNETYPHIAKLPLVIERCELQPIVRDTSSGFTKVSIVVRLSGADHVGEGEDGAAG